MLMSVSEFEAHVTDVEGFDEPLVLRNRAGRDLRGDKIIESQYNKLKAARGDWTWAKFEQERLKLPAGLSATLGGRKPHGNTKVKNLRGR